MLTTSAYAPLAMPGPPLKSCQVTVTRSPGCTTPFSGVTARLVTVRSGYGASVEVTVREVEVLLANDGLPWSSYSGTVWPTSVVTTAKKVPTPPAPSGRG